MTDIHKPDDEIPAGARALARLNASRQRLRQELLPDGGRPAANDSDAGMPLPRKLQALLRHWRFRLRHAPLAGMALTALQSWWHQHPLRVPGEALGSELRSSVVPLVRRHPVASVLIASAAGAALVAWRPWRWPLVARQIKPLPRSFGRWVMAQLSQPTVQTMLAAWLATSFSRSAAAAASQEEPLDDSVPPSSVPGSPTGSAPGSAPASAATAPAPGSPSAAAARPAPQAAHSAAPPPFSAPATPASQQAPLPQTAPAAAGKPPTQADSGIAASA